jgi:hypothetical protein
MSQASTVSCESFPVHQETGAWSEWEQDVCFPSQLTLCGVSTLWACQAVPDVDLAG